MYILSLFCSCAQMSSFRSMGFLILNDPALSLFLLIFLFTFLSISPFLLISIFLSIFLSHDVISAISQLFMRWVLSF